jgi:hypothetical protein
MPVQGSLFLAAGPIQVPVVIAPSGDTTGKTDWTNIQASINAQCAAAGGAAIQLNNGIYYINQPLVIPNQTYTLVSFCMIGTSGVENPDNGCLIRATAAMSAMIMCQLAGSTNQVGGVYMGGFGLDGFSLANYGVYFSQTIQNYGLFYNMDIGNCLDCPFYYYGPSGNYVLLENLACHANGAAYAYNLQGDWVTMINCIGDSAATACFYFVPGLNNVALSIHAYRQQSGCTAAFQTDTHASQTMYLICPVVESASGGPSPTYGFYDTTNYGGGMFVVAPKVLGQAPGTMYSATSGAIGVEAQSYLWQSGDLQANGHHQFNYGSGFGGPNIDLYVTSNNAASTVFKSAGMFWEATKNYVFNQYTTGVTTTATSLAALTTNIEKSLTPLYSGRIRIRATLAVANNTLSDSITVALGYGTSSGGEAATGYQETYTQEGLASNTQSVVLEQILTGLTVNTAYYFTIMAKVSAGTGSIYLIGLTVEEF